MGKKQRFASDLFEDESWITETEQTIEVADYDAVGGQVRFPHYATRKTARQRLEEYFELKRLRQLLDEELTGDVFEG